MSYVRTEPEVAKLLERSKYAFVAGFGDNTFEAITNKLIQIETYDLHDEELTAILFGKFKPYEASIGAITGFYVNAYDDPSGMGTDLLYSFKRLDDAMDLVEELQSNPIQITNTICNTTGYGGWSKLWCNLLLTYRLPSSLLPKHPFNLACLTTVN